MLRTTVSESVVVSDLALARLLISDSSSLVARKDIAVKLGKLFNFSAALASLILITAPAIGQSRQQSATPAGSLQHSAELGNAKTKLVNAETLAAQAKRPKAVASEFKTTARALSFAAPSSAVSAANGTAKLAVKDIVLDSSGKVTFTVVQSSGRPLAGQVASILSGNTQIARAATNAKGQVSVSGLKPGLHVFRTGLTKTMVRFWTLQTAPPQALMNPAIVDSSDLVRGQYGYGAPMAPGLIAATVTAVGVGVAVIGKSSGSENAAAVVPASP